MLDFEELLEEIKDHRGYKSYKLEDICEFKRGQVIRKDELLPGSYPLVAGGVSSSFSCDRFNRNYECLSVAASGAYAGTVNYWNIPFFCADAFTIKVKDTSLLLTKYLYYFLKLHQKDIYKKQKGGAIPHVYKSDLETFDIYIPSLTIQNKIVHFLDSFTALITALRTEEKKRKEKKRKEQYRGYRKDILEINDKFVDKFYTLDDLEKSKIVLLSDICEIKRGVRITKSDLTDTGYPVISGGVGIMGYYSNFNRDENTITIAQYGSAGYVNIQKEKFWANDVCYSLYPDTTKINNKFLYYFLTKEQEEIYKKVVHAAPDHLPLNELKKLNIWVPSLVVQERIVNFLDDLYNLSTNITNGLPAEIKLRQQEYQYYLEVLLSLSTPEINNH